MILRDQGREDNIMFILRSEAVQFLHLTKMELGTENRQRLFPCIRVRHNHMDSFRENTVGSRFLLGGVYQSGRADLRKCRRTFSDPHAHSKGWRPNDALCRTAAS